MSPLPLTEVEGIKIDRNNPEFNLALEIILSSSEHLYLTGKAGAGKTFFLKYLSLVCKKKMAIVAPTGIAAVNAGGVTMYSQFSIPPPYVYPPDDPRLGLAGQVNIFNSFLLDTEKLEIITNLELLVIDEISMVRADVLDVIDRLLRVRRRRKSVPFGGVQLLFIGDAFQLPPIVDEQARDLLRNHYNNYYFFGARVWREAMPLCVELTKIYRQSDPAFINILNNVRTNTDTATHLANMNKRFFPNIDDLDNEGYIEVCTKNAPADAKNAMKLAEINEESHFFQAEVTGEFPKKSYPTSVSVELKVGAQVMFLKNDFKNEIFNGMIGTVIKIASESEEEIVVRLKNGTTKSTGRAIWNNTKYQRDIETGEFKSETIGTFRQVPLRLAWAITVHKSQGMTFQNMIADIPDAWDPGQVYVALSRATSLDGIMLRRTIPPGAVHTAPAVVAFAQLIEETETKQVLANRKEAADLYYHAWEAGLAHDLEPAIRLVKKANRLHDLSGTENYKRCVSLIQAKIKWQKERGIRDAEKICNQRKRLSTLDEELTLSKNANGAMVAELKQLRATLAVKEREFNKVQLQLNSTRPRKWWQRLFGS